MNKLTKELALALEVASRAQKWGNPSPFQTKINELLVKAGRNPVLPEATISECEFNAGGHHFVNGKCEFCGDENE